MLAVNSSPIVGTRVASEIISEALPTFDVYRNLLNFLSDGFDESNPSCVYITFSPYE